MRTHVRVSRETWFKKGVHMKAREIANVGTVTEMKSILYNKLQDEGAGFKKSDIHIKAIEGGFDVWLTDYEHCTFRMNFGYDDYFGYYVQVECGSDEYPDEWGEVCFECSKKELDIKHALINIGYQMGTTF